MIQIFSKEEDKTIVEILTDDWHKDCQSEEEISVKRFTEKENFFLNGAVRSDETKQKHQNPRFNQQKTVQNRNQTAQKTNKSQIKRTQDDIEVLQSASNTSLASEKSTYNQNRRPRFNRYRRPNQRSRFPHKSNFKNKKNSKQEEFETGTILLPHRTKSRQVIQRQESDTLTIIPETQEPEETDTGTDNFLSWGQGSRNQDHHNSWE